MSPGSFRARPGRFVVQRNWRERSGASPGSNAHLGIVCPASMEGYRIAPRYPCSACRCSTPLSHINAISPGFIRPRQTRQGDATRIRCGSNPERGADGIAPAIAVMSREVVESESRLTARTLAQDGKFVFPITHLDGSFIAFRDCHAPAPTAIVPMQGIGTTSSSGGVIAGFSGNGVRCRVNRASEGEAGPQGFRLVFGEGLRKRAQAIRRERAPVPRGGAGQCVDCPRGVPGLSVELRVEAVGHAADARSIQYRGGMPYSSSNLTAFSKDGLRFMCAKSLA